MDRVGFWHESYNEEQVFYIRQRLGVQVCHRQQKERPPPEGGVFDFKNLLLLLHHGRSSQQLKNCCILFFAASLLMFLSCVGGAWSDYQQLVLSIVFYRTESNSSRAMYISFDAIL